MTYIQNHVPDGHLDPDEDQDRREPDPDEAYDRYRQECVDAGECITLGCANPHLDNQIVCEECQIVDEDSHRPPIYTKIGQYTGRIYYSYDQCYWWDEPQTAWDCYRKMKKGQ